MLKGLYRACQALFAYGRKAGNGCLFILISRVAKQQGGGGAFPARTFKQQKEMTNYYEPSGIASNKTQ